jgi:hypothetical protein
MLSKNIIGVESSYVFNISEVGDAKMCCEIINFVDVFQDELPYFPRQRNELFFFLPLEQMELVAVLMCYFCNKNSVRNVKWKESRLFRGAKNSYDSVIIQMLECLLLSKKLVACSYMQGAFSPNNKTLKIDRKPLKTS